MSQSSDQKVVTNLNELKGKRDELSQRKFKITAELESARKSYSLLKKEAESKFGTSNIDELKALLIKKREENDKTVETFAKLLAEAEEVIVTLETAIKSLQ